MTTDLATTTTERRVELAAFEPSTLTELMRFAEWMSDCALLPKHLQNKPKDFVLVAIKGRELGFTLMQSIACINVINGRAVVNAEGVAAKVLQHPKCDYFIPVESSAAVATYRTLRRGAPQPVELSWTLDMAKRAGLVATNQTYSRHTEAMLRARCAMALGRAVYPDALLGLVEHFEAEEIVGRPVPVGHVASAAASVGGAQYDVDTSGLGESPELGTRAEERPVVPRHSPKAAAAYALAETDAGVCAVCDALDDLGWRDDGQSVPISLDQAAAIWVDAKPGLTADTATPAWDLLAYASNAPSTRQLKLAVARVGKPPPEPPRGGGAPAPAANDAPTGDDPERAAIAGEPSAAPAARATPSDVQALRVAEEALRQCQGPQHVAAHYAAHLGELPLGVREEYRTRAVAYLAARYPRAVGSPARAADMLAAALLHRGEVAA